jgi:TP901 family phage tail tape measure protein
MSKGGAAAAATSLNMQQGLLNSINKTGQFSATVRNVRSTTESFTNALEKNKLSMREYFRYSAASTKTFGRFFTGEFDTINKVARERVKDLQTQYIKMGRDANGAMRAIAVRPLVLDMQNLGTKTQIAAQRQALLNQMLKQGSTNLLNFGKNTQWAGRQLMVGFTVPLIMFGAVASKAFMDLEKQAIRFKRVYGELFTTSEETDKAIQDIRSLANEFTKYGIAASKTMEIAADIAAMGKMGADLNAQVAETTRLAVLGGVEQGEALKATISLTDAFGTSAEDLAKKIDFLNAVENQTVTSIEDLTIAIPKAGPVVRQLGGDVEDLTFFLTAMREGGINASESANALKSGLASMINPAEKSAKFLENLGINLKGIVEANKGDIKGTVIQFANALDTLDPLNRARAIEQLFGKFQFARLSTLFQNVTREGNQASRVLKLANATTAELAILSERELKRVESSPLFKFQKAVEDIKVTLVPLGEAFLKAVTPILEFGTKILEQFNKLDEGAKSFVVALGAVGGVIGPVFLMGFGLVANGVANLIKMFVFFKTSLNKAASSSTQLGVQTEYMTQQQLEAAAVASSLDQVHQRLRQTFTSEASAVNALTAAYQRSIAAQARMTGGVVGRTRPPGLKLASGIMSVPGPKGAGDVVPAMLSPGEAVIPAKQSRKYSGIISSLISDNVPGFRVGRNPFASMLGRSRVAVRMKDKDFISSLRQDGKDARYKSAFETQTGADYIRESGSKTTRQRELRSAMERDVFGLDPKTTSPSSRPTYGYARTPILLSLVNRLFGLKGKNFNSSTTNIGDSLDKYGNIDLITKGSVAKRSSAFAGDALVNYNWATQAGTSRRIPDLDRIIKNTGIRPAPMRGASPEQLKGFERLGSPFGSNRVSGTNSEYWTNPKPAYLETYTPGGFSFKEIDKIIARDPAIAKQLKQELRSAGLGAVRVVGPGFISRLFKNMGVPGFSNGSKAVTGQTDGKYWLEYLGKRFDITGKRPAYYAEKLPQTIEAMLASGRSPESVLDRIEDYYKRGKDFVPSNLNNQATSAGKRLTHTVATPGKAAAETLNQQVIKSGIFDNELKFLADEAKKLNISEDKLTRFLRIEKSHLRSAKDAPKNWIDFSGIAPDNGGVNNYLNRVEGDLGKHLLGFDDKKLKQLRIDRKELEKLVAGDHPATKSSAATLRQVAKYDQDVWSKTKPARRENRHQAILVQKLLNRRLRNNFYSANLRNFQEFIDQGKIQDTRKQSRVISGADPKVPSNTKVKGGSASDTKMGAFGPGETILTKKTGEDLKNGRTVSVPRFGKLSMQGASNFSELPGHADGFPKGQYADGTERVYKTESGQYRDRATKKRLQAKEAKRLMAQDRQNERRRAKAAEKRATAEKRSSSIGQSYGMSSKDWDKATRDQQAKLRAQRKQAEAAEKQRRVAETNARIADEQKIADEKKKLAVKEEKRAERQSKMQGMGGKVAGGVAALGMVGVVGGSMMGGQIGEIANQLMMPVMILSMVLPMLKNVSPVFLGLLAAAGVLTAGFINFAMAADRGRKEGILLAQSMTMTNEKLTELSKLTGTVSATELRQKEQSDRLSSVNNAQIQEEADVILDSEFGKGLIEEAKNLSKTMGSPAAAAKSFATQLSSAVAQGVITTEQAKALGEKIGQTLESKEFSIEVVANINTILGPRGENLEKEPLKVLLDIQKIQQDQIDTAFQTASAGQGSPLNLATGAQGVIGAGIGVSGLLDIAAGKAAANAAAKEAVDVATKQAAKTAGGIVARSLAKIGVGAAASATGVGAIAGIPLMVAGVAEMAFGGWQIYEAVAAAGKIQENNNRLNSMALTLGMQQIVNNEQLLDSLNSQYDAKEAELEAQIAAEKNVDKRIELETELDALLKKRASDTSTLNAANADVMTGVLESAKGLGLDEIKNKALEQNKITNANDIFERDATTLVIEEISKLKNQDDLEAHLLIGVSMGLIPTEVANLLALASQKNPQVGVEYMALVTTRGTAEANEITALLAAGGVDKDGAQFPILLKYMQAGDIDAVAELIKLKGFGIDIDLDVNGGERITRAAETLEDLKDQPDVITMKIATDIDDADGDVYEKIMQEWQSQVGPDGVLSLPALSTVSLLVPEVTISQVNKYLADRGIYSDFLTTEQKLALYSIPVAISLAGIDEEGNVPKVEVPKPDLGGAKKEDPYNSINKSLKELRNNAVNATGGIKELQKWLGKGKDMRPFKGAMNALVAGGTTEEFQDFASDLSKKQQKDLFTVSDGVAKLTGKGKALQKAFNEVSIGRFVIDQQRALANAKNQDIAAKRLIAAGMSTSDAYEAVEDSAFAAGIAMMKLGKKGRKELKTIVDSAKKAKNALEGLSPDDLSDILKESIDVARDRIQIDFEFKVAGDMGVLRAAESEISALQFQVDDFQAGLQQISWKEDEINKKYDKRSEALDKINTINSQIADQQKGQLSIADALSRGDLSAAAKAIQDFRASEAQRALDGQKDALEAARERELAAVRSSDGKSRLQLEDSILEKEKEIFKVEEERLEPARERVRLAESAKDIAITSLDLQSLGYDDLTNKIKSAELGTVEYQKRLREALTILQDMAKVQLPGPSGAGAAGAGAAGAGDDGKGYKGTRPGPDEDGTKKGQVLSGPKHDWKWDGKKWNKLAVGGYVSGAGTPTSDSIPAMLSDGEYVIRASSVNKFGQDFLDNINAGRLPGFKRGGRVNTSNLAGIKAASTSQETKNRNAMLADKKKDSAIVDAVLKRKQTKAVVDSVTKAVQILPMISGMSEGIDIGKSLVNLFGGKAGGGDYLTLGLSALGIVPGGKIAKTGSKMLDAVKGFFPARKGTGVERVDGVPLRNPNASLIKAMLAKRNLHGGGSPDIQSFNVRSSGNPENFFGADFFTSTSRNTVLGYKQSAGSIYNASMPISQAAKLKLLDLYPGAKSIEDQFPGLTAKLPNMIDVAEKVKRSSRSKVDRAALDKYLNSPDRHSLLAENPDAASILHEFGIRGIRHQGGTKHNVSEVFAFIDPQNMVATQLGKKRKPKKLPSIFSNEQYRNFMAKRELAQALRNPAIITRRSSGSIDNMLRTDKSVTLFDTGESAASADKGLRATFEGKNFGSENIGNMMYGYLANKKKLTTRLPFFPRRESVDTFDPFSFGTRQYGDAIIELNKSAMRRASLTAGDSLENFFGMKGGIPLGLADPKFITKNLGAARKGDLKKQAERFNTEKDSYIEAQFTKLVPSQDIKAIWMSKEGVMADRIRDIIKKNKLNIPVKVPAYGSNQSVLGNAASQLKKIAQGFKGRFRTFKNNKFNLKDYNPFTNRFGKQKELEMNTLAKGGMVRPQYFAQGGMVKGYAKGGDVVPSMLTPGEFVMKKAAVSSLGEGFLSMLNDGKYQTRGLSEPSFQGIGANPLVNANLVTSNTSVVSDNSSVYNYNLSVNVASMSDPNAIAQTVMGQIRQIDSQRLRGNRF